MPDQERNIVQPPEQTRWFRAEDLQNTEFYRANKDEIRRAMRLGQIIPRVAYAVRGSTTQATREARKGTR